MFNEGTLIITNKYNSAYTTELVKTPTGGVTDLDVGSVHICGNGRLEITNATLTVRGSWINEGNFIANQDAVVEFVDATKVSTIKGKNAFKNFYCTEPGKKLVFGTSDKDKLSITDNGSIKLIGNEEGNVIIPVGEFLRNVLSAEINKHRDKNRGNNSKEDRKHNDQYDVHYIIKINK